MARPVAHITTSPLSLDELAKELGISKARQRALSALAKKAFAEIQADRKPPKANGFKKGKKIANATAAD
jgi:predicted ArsR family transcriptional regulator